MINIIIFFILWVLLLMLKKIIVLNFFIYLEFTRLFCQVLFFSPFLIEFFFHVILFFKANFSIQLILFSCLILFFFVVTFQVIQLRLIFSFIILFFFYQYIKDQLHCFLEYHFKLNEHIFRQVRAYFHQHKLLELQKDRKQFYLVGFHHIFVRFDLCGKVSINCHQYSSL